MNEFYVDPSYEGHYQESGSFMDMAIYRNKRIGTHNRESILLRREVPDIDPREREFRLLRGSLTPGVATCAGCAAPVVFNLVAKAAQMRELYLRKALLAEGILSEKELDRPEVMKLFLKEGNHTDEDLEKTGISEDILGKVDGIRQELIQDGLYFKLMFAGATGCMTVTTASFPNNVWRFPYFHSAFENLGAMVAGLEAGARARLRNGRIKTPHKVIGFAGDGGSYDIGLQSLSGLWERNQDSLTITYDNEAYMNTGKQRCSSTPWGADTTTAPVGQVIKGKEENPKDIVSIAIAHNLPYVATASPDDPEDLMIKVRKALMIPGASYLRILAPCPPGWGSEARDAIKLCTEAINTSAFFSFEVETDMLNRRRYFTVNNIPAPFFSSEEKRAGFADYASIQKRFKHMMSKNQEMLYETDSRMGMTWTNFANFFGLNN